MTKWGGTQHRPALERFEEKVSPEPMSGCHLWLGAVMKNGYGRFGVTATDIRQAHRYALELAGRPAADDQIVMHLCNTRCCVNPLHLKAGSQRENMEQASREGRMVSPKPKGLASPHAIFKPSQVREVRRHLTSGLSRASVARLFNVSWSLINSIASGRSYGEVT